MSGAKKGKTEVLIDGLPGYPDNIRSNGRGGFYISLLFSRTPDVCICTTLCFSNLVLKFKYEVGSNPFPLIKIEPQHSGSNCPYSSDP